MDTGHIVMTLAGLGLLLLLLWSRTESGAGWWYPPRSQNMPRLVMWVGPLFALVMVIAGLMPLVRGTALGSLATFVVIVALVAGVVGVFIRVPTWAMPGWVRDQVASAARDRKDLHG